MEGILNPILFTLGGPYLNVNPVGRLGVPPFLGCRLMVRPVTWTIAGVSRDSTGAVLAGCTCTLFRVTTDGSATRFEQEQQVVSGADGAYVFTGSSPEPYTYRVTFDLAGGPTRAGLTLHTLVGV